MNIYGTFKIDDRLVSVYDVNGSSIAVFFSSIGARPFVCFSAVKPFDFVKDLFNEGWSPSANETFSGDVDRLVNESASIFEKYKSNKKERKYID
jgi:hypothetical protein